MWVIRFRWLHGWKLQPPWAYLSFYLIWPGICFLSVTCHVSIFVTLKMIEEKNILRFKEYAWASKKKSKTVKLLLCIQGQKWPSCITVVHPSFFASVWTEETQCTLLNISITETFNCSFSCGPECSKNSQYPCLQVYVNVSSSGQKYLLYHTEETIKINSEVRTSPVVKRNALFVVWEGWDSGCSIFESLLSRFMESDCPMCNLIPSCVYFISDWNF